MSSDAAGQDRNVVSPFENADDPAMAVGVRHCDNLFRQGLEILDIKAEVADWVFGMRIEARAHKHELGASAFSQSFEAGAKCGVILGACRTVGNWDVECRAKAGTRACLVPRAGAWIERKPMDREESYTIGLVK